MTTARSRAEHSVRVVLEFFIWQGLVMSNLCLYLVTVQSEWVIILPDRLLH